MARKAKGKDEVSAEYKNFEVFAKQILSVPKTEIDRREVEDRKGRDAKRKQA